MRAFVVVGLLAPALAHAERPANSCVAVDVDFTPTDALQIVAWVERADGSFVDTIYITNKTGRFGLGNRPGRSDFNTGAPLTDSFPYGRRTQTFPVWAHRHGKTFPLVMFQNGDENNLSHSVLESSLEYTYSRPFEPGREQEQFDAGTTASDVQTDKGKFAGGVSLYPPRSELERREEDSPDVEQFRANNPFDAVSRPTPLGGAATTMSWAAPPAVDYGSYVLFVETSKTYDFNATYNEATFPSPAGIPWATYGKAWRGQPSIIYSVPFAIATTAGTATTDAYVGYGDALGETGALSPPDATITTNTPGSGAARLQLVSDAGTMFRARVRTTHEFDATPPDPVGTPTIASTSGTTATIGFVASGDDGMTGTVTGYEIRVRANSPMTRDNFVDSTAITASVTPDAAGRPQSVEITGLMPETDYWIGIVPFDNCFNKGELRVATFTTTERDVPEVPWCFVATAAYGSAMAADVAMLRRFRDHVLARTVFGELAVQTYYTFSPPAARVIAQSELLRASARAALEPIVARVRDSVN